MNQAENLVDKTGTLDFNVSLNSSNFGGSVKYIHNIRKGLFAFGSGNVNYLFNNKKIDYNILSGIRIKF